MNTEEKELEKASRRTDRWKENREREKEKEKARDNGGDAAPSPGIFLLSSSYPCIRVYSIFYILIQSFLEGETPLEAARKFDAEDAAIHR